MAVIYQITNMINGKYYIGSAQSFERRSWQHKYDLKNNRHKNPKLQAAWNKYGEDAFVFEVLEEIPVGEDQLAWENKYLHMHVGKLECYNINKDAELARLGATLSEKSKAKLSANRTGKAAGEEHYRYGQTLTEDVRQKIGNAQRGKPKAKGRKVSAEGMAKIRAAAEAGHYDHWKGRKHTEEAKQKMSKRVFEITNNQEFPSLTAVLNHYSMKMPTLRRALLSGEPISKGKFAGLWFKYLGITC